ITHSRQTTPHPAPDAAHIPQPPSPPRRSSDLPSRSDSVGHQTPLYQQHLNAGARMVNFSGWDMPIQYQSVIEEHQAVRQHAGVRSEEHTSELQSRENLVCRLLLEKKKKKASIN